MSIEDFPGFAKPPVPAAEKIARPGDKLEGFKAALWERTKAIFSRIGLDLAGKAGLTSEKAAVKEIKGIRNNNEDYKFLDLEVELAGEQLALRSVAQVDDRYQPDREKNYDNWDLTPQEEAERWLNREILVNEKLAKFMGGVSVSADEMVKGNRDPKSGPMFLLKRVAEQEKEQEEYGEAEGRALAATLLEMQKRLRATDMVNEIMVENGIETKLEMEQKVFEDYFDHFDGYMENSQGVLEDLGDKALAERLAARMEQYREVIDDCQLEDDEYSLVHGNINFDTVRYSKEGRATLSDWQLAGKTQNKELSLVYDLGHAMQAAVENLDSAQQAEAFIGGVEAEIKDFYKERPAVAEAVINLTKLRSFAMIVNDQEGEKKDLILKGLGEKN